MSYQQQRLIIHHHRHHSPNKKPLLGEVEAAEVRRTLGWLQKKKKAAPSLADLFWTAHPETAELLEVVI